MHPISHLIVHRCADGGPGHRLAAATRAAEHTLDAVQMEGMVTDLQLAREKQAEFDRWKRDNNKQLPVELSVTVLTTGFWPTYKVCPRCSDKQCQNDPDAMTSSIRFWQANGKACIYLVGMLNAGFWPTYKVCMRELAKHTSTENQHRGWKYHESCQLWPHFQSSEDQGTIASFCSDHTYLSSSAWQHVLLQGCH